MYYWIIFIFFYVGLILLFSIEIYAWIVVVSLFRKMAMIENIRNQVVLPISTHDNGFTSEGYLGDSPVRPASYDIWKMNKYRWKFNEEK